ncbi:MAG: hypothetical protein WA191_12785 [Telluria sp.]|nr:hypothetical protein [Telluria sp.]
MFSALRKSVALAMFVIFMANLGLWNFQAQLDHGLDHTTYPALALQGADHVHDAPGHDDDASGASQHQLLHAADHVHPYPAAAFAHIEVALHEARSDAFRAPFVPAATSESLFRPPRFSLSPG